MPRLLPPGILVALLLLTPVGNGGSVAPAVPAALPPTHSQYNGKRLDLPGCNCKGRRNLTARGGALFTVTPSDRKWGVTIMYEDTVFDGEIAFADETYKTGKMTLNGISISQSDARFQPYPGDPRTFDVTVTRNGRDITIKQGGWCARLRDRFCFIGRA